MVRIVYYYEKNIVVTVEVIKTLLSNKSFKNHATFYCPAAFRFPTLKCLDFYTEKQGHIVIYF